MALSKAAMLIEFDVIPLILRLRFCAVFHGYYDVQLVILSMDYHHQLRLLAQRCLSGLPVQCLLHHPRANGKQVFGSLGSLERLLK